MARSTGVMTRTTNGTATSACAIGISHDEPAEVEGRVVERDEEAEADGDRRDAERERDQRVEAAPARRRRARTPRSRRRRTAITVATAANRSELAIASIGGTNSVLPACTSPRAR